jgi:hypothetical protein
VEIILFETVARLAPEYLATVVRAEQKAEPEMIGFGDPDA